LYGALRLSDWGVIRARGEEAAAFLQGQLTNDVVALATGQARLAGYCSAKGRLLASFVVWRDGQGDFLLACSADLLVPTLKRLSMFVLRAKCKLSDASAEVPLSGLAGDAALAALPALGVEAPRDVWAVAPLPDAGAGVVVRLPDAVVDGAAVPRLLLAGAAAPSTLPALDAATWQWLEVQSGAARIVAATVEQFVPQMINLELVGGVNFQKGCYPGQEVVARSQYRGTLKRRAYILGTAASMAPGQEVVHDADPGQPAGMVVLAGAHGGRHAALVELKIAATEGGSLHLGGADGPTLVLESLPYALPLAAA
jgi:folate-binding protein YgfZ